MKKLVALMLGVITIVTLNAQTTPEVNNEVSKVIQPEVNNEITKVVQFKETDHDFGKIPYGKPAIFNLEMTNISNEPVAIEDVKVGCGCTTPKWKTGPFAAGENFDITIGFNGYSKGPFTKTVTVLFKGGLSQTIKFHGETYKAPDNAAPANEAVQQLKTGGK